MSAPSADPLIGAQFGSCVVESKVAVGGFATIYRATDTNLGIPRAVKIFHPHLTGNRELGDRLHTEMQVLATLDHPNIVKIAFSINESEHSGFVMEFVEGSTLSDLIARRRKVPLAEALAIFEQILSAIDYAHSRQIIHRDLTPDNVMVKPDGTVKIMDFGISKTLHRPNVTQEGIVLGKPLYMAPEQFEGEVTVFADQYALGVILYELLTGMVPFEGDSPIALYRQHMEAEVRLPRQFVGQLPSYVEKSIYKALAKSPAKRFESVSVFLSVLRKREWPEVSPEELRERYETALLLFRRGEIETASERLQEVLSADPTHEDARRLLDSCASDREQHAMAKKASKAYREALAAHHRRADAKDVRTHLVEFMESASQVPEIRAVRKLFRDVRRRFGTMLEDIRATTRERSRQREAEVHALIERGKEQLERADYEGAAESFDKVLGLEPNPEARELFAKSRSTVRINQARALHQRALAALADEDYPLAMAKLEQVLRIDPGNEDAQRGLTMAKDALARQQAAGRDQIARQHEVDHHLEAGVRHLEAWEHEEAVARLRQVIDLAPTHERARALLAEAEARLADADQMSAISLFFEQGLSCYQCGKFGEATTLFDKVLALFPKHGGALEYAQRAKDAHERHERIEALVEEAARAFRNGDYATARNRAERALELDHTHREAARFVQLTDEMQRATSGGDAPVETSGASATGPTDERPSAEPSAAGIGVDAGTVPAAVGPSSPVADTNAPPSVDAPATDSPVPNGAPSAEVTGEGPSAAVGPVGGTTGTEAGSTGAGADAEAPSEASPAAAAPAPTEAAATPEAKPDTTAPPAADDPDDTAP